MKKLSVKNKKTIILIETIVIVVVLLTINFCISTLPRILKISQTTNLLVILVISILLIVVCLVLVFDRNEKFSFSFFLNKFRFKKTTRKTFYVAFGVFFISGILSGLIKFFLVKYGMLNDSNQQFELASFYKRQESSIFLFLTVLTTLILIPIKEEILFRGYLLPKQEIVLGRFAWILNGFAFTLAHIVVYDISELLLISPSSFLIAYKVQKYKDSSIGLLAHFFMNVPFIVKLFIA